MTNCKQFSVINNPSTNTDINIIGVAPIIVEKTYLGDITNYTINIDELEIPIASNGKDGIDGISPTITINSVTQGDNPQVTNVGDEKDVKLNFVLPKGKDGLNGNDGENGTDGKDGINGTNGDDGKDGITKGISSYYLAVGNNSGTLIPMGNYNQGQYIDLLNNDYKRLRVRAWVTVGNVRHWTGLRLTRGNTPSYNNTTLIAQRIYNTENEGFSTQWEINAYVETTDKFIGFTFTDTPGNPFNSDGSQYGDYGIEVFILD